MDVTYDEGTVLAIRYTRKGMRMDQRLKRDERRMKISEWAKLDYEWHLSLLGIELYPQDPKASLDCGEAEERINFRHVCMCGHVKGDHTFGKGKCSTRCSCNQPHLPACECEAFEERTLLMWLDGAYRGVDGVPVSDFVGVDAEREIHRNRTIILEGR